MDMPNQLSDGSVSEPSPMEVDAPAENLTKDEGPNGMPTMQSPVPSASAISGIESEASKVVPSIKLPSAAFHAQDSAKPASPVTSVNPSLAELERANTPSAGASHYEKIRPGPMPGIGVGGVQSKVPIARSPVPPNSAGLPPIHPHHQQQHSQIHHNTQQQQQQQHALNIANYGRAPIANRMISPNVIPGAPPASSLTNKEAPGLPLGPGLQATAGVLLPSASSASGGSANSGPTYVYPHPSHPGHPAHPSHPSHPAHQSSHSYPPQQIHHQPHYPPHSQYYQGPMQQYQANPIPPTRPPTAPGAEGQKVALTDAFSYLDRVKAEFVQQPEVYNKFLQVMREFKSNVIDANGVIGRVVHLFRGHRDLILGFNAFLPKTHHIDASVAESGYYPGMPPSSSGPTSPQPPQPLYPSIAPQRGQAGGPYPQPSVHHPGLSQTSQMHHWTFDVNSRGERTGGPSSTNEVRTPSAAMPTASNPNIPSLMDDESAAGPTSRANNAQFSRAISYVKKVKHRFANDAESYKTFLAALHSFHKDQKTVNEVYNQVTRLFKDHPDLLEEFMQFLPDGENIRRSSTLPPLGQFSPPSNNNNNNHAQLDRGARKTGGNKRARHNAEAPSLPSVQKTQEELDFFDRVKNFIGNKNAYAEFLKCLNLYSQDILRQDELVKLVSNFIGSSTELFSWFKRYIGYSGKLDFGVGGASAAEDASSEEAPSMSRRRRRDIESRDRDASPGPHDIPELNLGECKRIHSYRLLPAGYHLPPATGRDDVGKEVLNDQLLCCASFESEDSTFVSSRKNQYEEALFRCEDERFELDLLIEGNRATMAVLEPILRRLESLSKEERESFRLDSKLNGHSAMIYRRNIVRIYGDKAEDIMEALQKSPAIAIPVVLKRLRQKDEEWRQTLREWNSVWRTVHLKNYYKALDHQGIDFKQNDRKNLSVKTCITEAESKGQDSWRADLEMSSLNDALGLIEQTLRGTCVLSSSDRKAALDTFLLVRDEFLLRNDIEPLVMYTNGSLLALVRLIQMASERLLNIKRVAQKANLEPHHSRKVSVVASFLDLIPSEFTSGDGSGEGKQTEGDLYASLLELTRNLLSGSLDIAVYEERVRFMFGTEAFPMYTFDRLVSVIIRCLQQNIVNDPTCENLLRLFSTWKAGRVNDSSSGLRLSEWTARMACENIVSQSREGHLYRIERTPEALAFQMVPSLGNTQDSLPRAEDAWSAYIDEFVNRIDANPKYLLGGSPVFLPRTLRKSVNKNPGGISDRLLIRYRLECKICINTFRLLFVAGTEDLLWKSSSRPIRSRASVEIPVSGS